LLKNEAAYPKKYMFVKTNFLKMIRIGILGSDKRLLTVCNQIKTLGDIELVGCYCEDYNCADTFSTSAGIVSFPTPDALFRYADAVIMNFDMAGNVPLIIKCLKNFKHVFSIDAHSVKYKDFEYLEKIAEESNVKFYPAFGTHNFNIPGKLYNSLSGFHYLNINHSVSCWPGVASDEKLFSALLQDLSFVMNLGTANIKRINANGWNLCGPGAGMLNARLDFDNGSMVNILIVNAIVAQQFQATCYNLSVRTDITIEEGIGRALLLPLTEGMPENILITMSPDEAMVQRVVSFIAAIRQNPDGLRALENQFKTIRVNYIIHEKINNFSSKNILYS
jgi:hypothetical protein